MDEQQNTYVELPDGTYLEVPAGTPREEVHRRIEARYPFAFQKAAPVPVPQALQGQNENGALHFLRSVGVPTSMGDVKNLLHPPQGESALSTVPLLGPAFEAQRQTWNRNKGLGLIPLAGPVIERAAEQVGQGDWTGAAGSATGLGLMGLGARNALAGKGMLSKMGARTKAGRLYDTLDEKVGAEPVTNPKLAIAAGEGVGELEGRVPVPQVMQRVATRVAESGEEAPLEFGGRAVPPEPYSWSELAKDRSFLGDKVWDNNLGKVGNAKTNAAMQKVYGAATDTLRDVAEHQGYGPEWAEANKLYKNALGTERLARGATEGLGRAAGAFAGYGLGNATGVPHAGWIGAVGGAKVAGGLGKLLGNRIGSAITRTEVPSPVAAIPEVVKATLPPSASVGKRVRVIDPQGLVGSLPEEQVQDALAHGYRLVP